MKCIKYKRIILCFMLCIICLLGCGQDNNNLASSQEKNVIGEDDVNGVGNTKSTGNAKENDMEKDENIFCEEKKIVVNLQEQMVRYIREDDIDPLRALHRCASDGENIFLAYSEKDIYKMEVGSDKHSPINIDNPNEMNVCNVVVDSCGKIHLLIADRGYEEWFIWCLDEQFQIDKVIDISEFCDTKYIPIWFLVDKEGTYYLQWPLDRHSILVNGDGEIVHELTPEWLGVDWIYEASVGKDGKIYLVYSTIDDKLKIGELDVEKGSIKESKTGYYFPANEVFSVMSAGTDTNLLLFSPYSGIWAYDEEKEIFENRVELSEISFEEDVEYWPFLFLPDGRLLMFGCEMNNEVSTEQAVVVNYVPAGR